MAYCTLAQLTDRYGERMLVGLTDRGEVATGAIDADVVARAIADADAMVDGYLRARYALPVAEPVPPLLATLAMQVAIYHLHTSEPDAKVVRDYEAALKQLQSLAAGTVQIDAAPVAATGSTASGSGARSTDRERVVTPESLTGFV